MFWYMEPVIFYPIYSSSNDRPKRQTTLLKALKNISDHCIKLLASWNWKRNIHTFFSAAIFNFCKNISVEHARKLVTILLWYYIIVSRMKNKKCVICHYYSTKVGIPIDSVGIHWKISKFCRKHISVSCYSIAWLHSPSYQICKRLYM